MNDKRQMILKDERIKKYKYDPQKAGHPNLSNIYCVLFVEDPSDNLPYSREKIFVYDDNAQFKQACEYSKPNRSCFVVKKSEIIANHESRLAPNPPKDKTPDAIKRYLEKLPKEAQKLYETYKTWGNTIYSTSSFVKNRNQEWFEKKLQENQKEGKSYNVFKDSTFEKDEKASAVFIQHFASKNPFQGVVVKFGSDTERQNFIDNNHNNLNNLTNSSIAMLDKTSEIKAYDKSAITIKPQYEKYDRSTGQKIMGDFTWGRIATAFKNLSSSTNKHFASVEEKKTKGDFVYLTNQKIISFSNEKERNNFVTKVEDILANIKKDMKKGSLAVQKKGKNDCMVQVQVISGKDFAHNKDANTLQAIHKIIHDYNDNGKTPLSSTAHIINNKQKAKLKGILEQKEMGFYKRN